MRLDGDLAGGSGTCVWADDYHGLILTARHIVDGHKLMSVTFPGGAKMDGIVLGSDMYGSDLGAIEIVRKASALLSVPQVAVAARGPEVNEQVVKIGYPGATNRAMDVGYGLVFPNPVDDQILIRAQARPGDSGGGIFNTRGELVSVLHSKRRDGSVVASTYGATAAFYQRVCQRWFNPKSPKPYPDQPPVQPPAQPPWNPKDGAQGPQGPQGPPGAPADGSKLQRALDVADKVEPWIGWLGPIAAGAVGGPLGLGLGAGVWGLRALLRLRRSAKGSKGQNGSSPPVIAPQEPTGVRQLFDRLGKLEVILAAVPKGVPVVSDLASKISNLEQRVAGMLRPIINESPAPLPQVVQETTKYVQVDKVPNDWDAMQIALDEYAKKYPGASGTIETLRSWQKQIKNPGQ